MEELFLEEKNSQRLHCIIFVIQEYYSMYSLTILFFVPLRRGFSLSAPLK
ncbi:hypothetical protein HMPREF1869_01631 [Bacteroidales bacterium KA00251]|nr:hypothetical protein HMPREF1869_01631 [Bacteroidales bacterium KA00251]